MSYIIPRVRWHDIIVLNVHAPTQDKIDDMKDSFYEELKRVFEKFPKYHMKIWLGDFNAEVGREDIFKPTIGNESLHEISRDNGVRLVNFSTSRNLIVKSTMFSHRKIHKFLNKFLKWYSFTNITSVKKTKLNSVALVRKRTIQTERPPLVDEVSANFCG
jgi:hypothetical protein